jgi:Protein of unknown function (DUF3775)
MTLAETVQRIVSLARAAREARIKAAAAGSPVLTSGYIDMGLDTTKPVARAEIELRQFLSGLPPDMVFTLTAIMYLGRGDFAAPDFQDHVKEAKLTFGDPNWAISLMLGKLSLPELLEEGLDKLGQERANAVMS